MTMTENQQREQNWGIMFSPNLIYCAYDTSHIRKTTINNPSLNILHMFLTVFFNLLTCICNVYENAAEPPGHPLEGSRAASNHQWTISSSEYKENRWLSGFIARLSCEQSGF